MKYIISESQLNSFLRRRSDEIEHLVGNALERVSPGDYPFHDYVEEIAWQVADEYRISSSVEIDTIMDYVREKYGLQIEAYYLGYFGRP